MIQLKKDHWKGKRGPGAGRRLRTETERPASGAWIPFCHWNDGHWLLLQPFWPDRAQLESGQLWLEKNGRRKEIKWPEKNIHPLPLKHEMEQRLACHLLPLALLLS